MHINHHVSVFYLVDNSVLFSNEMQLTSLGLIRLKTTQTSSHLDLDCKYVSMVGKRFGMTSTRN